MPRQVLTLKGELHRGFQANSSLIYGRRQTEFGSITSVRVSRTARAVAILLPSERLFDRRLGGVNCLLVGHHHV